MSLPNTPKRKTNTENRDLQPTEPSASLPILPHPPMKVSSMQTLNHFCYGLAWLRFYLLLKLSSFQFSSLIKTIDPM